MPTRKPRRDAGARVAAKQHRRDRILVGNASRAIDRVKAVAELEDLRDRTSYIGAVIPGTFGIGYIAVVICIAPATTDLVQTDVARIGWYRDARKANLAAHARATTEGGDHRAR